jgi:ABC-type multidrug transport system fused ATPase/permease subunit
LTSDIDSLTAFIQGSLGQLVTATLTFFGVLGIMLMLSPPLTLAVLTLVPAFAVAVFGIGLFALPAGMLGAAFTEALEQRNRAAGTCPTCGRVTEGTP